MCVLNAFISTLKAFLKRICRRLPKRHTGSWGGGDIPKSGVNFKTLDWEKDEHIIFPALSKAAGYEVRNVPYLHWWVLVGLFNEVSPDGLFSQVLAIRSKLARGKTLSKTELEFYNLNRQMIDLNRLSDEKEREDEELIRLITGEV